LREFGIPVVLEHVAGDVEEAVSAAEKTGFSVALKGLGRAFSHKGEDVLFGHVPWSQFVGREDVWDLRVWVRHLVCLNFFFRFFSKQPVSQITDLAFQFLCFFL